MNVAVFCLVKGKTTLFGYRALIQRNWSLRRNLDVGLNSSICFIVFHEGNVSHLQQSFIRFASRMPITFTDIGAIFRPFPNQSISGKSSAAGYSLMCRFMYLQVWDYLRDFDIVARVDDDCIVRNLPLELPEGLVFQGGIFKEDSHEPTNESLPEVLGAVRASHWDPRVVNTCVYVTKMSFWAEPGVMGFLREIGGHDLALEKRWGDHRVLGIALKMFGQWTRDESVVNPEIDYLHFSHNQRISGGSSKEMQNFRTLVLLFRRLAYFFYTKLGKPLAGSVGGR